MAKPKLSDVREQYLFDYLVEEFKRNPEVRIRVMREDGIAGVSVRTDARQYFFPIRLATASGMAEVSREIERIREILPDQRA